MPSAISRNRRLGTACDRCYDLKERCERASITAACARCDRLAQVCLTVRPKRPAGRRPQHQGRSAGQTSSSRSSTDSQSPPDVGSWLFEVSGLGQEEKELLMFLLEKPQTLEYYVVSPSFEDAEQRSLASPLPAAFSVLKDAYLAYAGVLKSFHPGTVAGQEDENSNENLRRASAAMITLRTLPVATSKDAALCLALGIALALFVYAAVGVGVSDICRCCISSARPFIETAALDPETESRLIFLVLLETMECMVYRRKPTLRIQSRAPQSVDRHIGLCLPLLPYYYDLCVISHSLANTTNVGLVIRLHQQLDGIQSFVNAWQPSPAERFFQQFDTLEVIHLLAQARVYRMAALLMAHRLRHTFGEEDGQADIWSSEVLNELELARRITKKSMRFVTLPYIIAAVEIRDPLTRIKTVEDVDHYVDQFAPVVQKATKAFLWRVWHERDIYKKCSWIDSIHKPCVILDSIEASFLLRSPEGS